MRSINLPKAGLSCRLPDDFIGTANLSKAIRLEVSEVGDELWIEVHVRKEQAGGKKAWEIVVAEECDPALLTESRLERMVEEALDL